MIRLLIADDDTIVRTSVKTMVDWEAAGIAIVAEAADGRQALDMLKQTSVDVLLTDIKMPNMDGISLLKEAVCLPAPPVVVMLSAYDEFFLVREAFTLGAVDYLLKSELTPQGILACIQAAAEKVSGVRQREAALPVAPSSLREVVLSGRLLTEVIEAPCMLAVFDLDDYDRAKDRFGPSLEKDLVHPLLDFAGQIHRVKAYSQYCSLSSSRYLFAFSLREINEEAARAACLQVARAWKTYMNLSVSIGLSRPAQDAASIAPCFEEAMENASMRLVFGHGQMLDGRMYAAFDLPAALAAADGLAPLLDALKCGNSTLLSNERSRLFTTLFDQPVAQARQQTLAVIYHVALFLLSMGTALEAAFGGEQYNYVQRIGRLTSVNECEIWTANFLRHIEDSLARHVDAYREDAMELARRHIIAELQNPALSVRTVADAVGLSEKYFSTRFNKTYGMSITSFVNTLRVDKAKRLLRETDLKIYAVAEAVGFRNTEHFIRVFRKLAGMPPSGYKKSISNDISTNRT